MKKYHDLQKMKEDSTDKKEELSDNIAPDNLISKFLTRQSKQTRLIILISVIGLLVFTLIATTTPFKDTLLNLLYPKPSSQATDPIDDLTRQLLEGNQQFKLLEESTPSAVPTGSPTPTPKAPDLVVNSIQVLGTARVKSKNSINVTIENKGNSTVKTRGTLALKITQPNKTDLGSCNGSFSSPAVNKTTIVQIRNCPAFKTSGTHTITATVDSTNTIPESNENNNQSTTTINVR